MHLSLSTRTLPASTIIAKNLSLTRRRQMAETFFRTYRGSSSSYFTFSGCLLCAKIFCACSWEFCLTVLQKSTCSFLFGSDIAGLLLALNDSSWFCYCSCWGRSCTRIVIISVLNFLSVSTLWCLLFTRTWGLMVMLTSTLVGSLGVAFHSWWTGRL